jgi:hypothetical protein
MHLYGPNPAGFYVDTSLARGCARAMDSMIMRMCKKSQNVIFTSYSRVSMEPRNVILYSDRVVITVYLV